MKHGWILRLNMALMVVAAFTILQATLTHFSRPEEIAIPKPSEQSFSLPIRPFVQDKQKYEEIGPPFIENDDVSTSLRLPDLREEIQFLGLNQRPEVPSNRPILLFSMKGNNYIANIPLGEPLYINFHRSDTAQNNKGKGEDNKIEKNSINRKISGRYSFSKNNEETSLWIQGFPNGKNAYVLVSLLNDSGDIITTPKELSRFELKKSPLDKRLMATWRLGSYQVTPYLFESQGARWYGRDTFLERHGGAEYKIEEGEERLQFVKPGSDSRMMSSDNPLSESNSQKSYTIYFKPSKLLSTYGNDSLESSEVLAWIDGRWEKVSLNADIKEVPIITVEKIEPLVLTLKLWDVDGKRTINLPLKKYIQRPMERVIENDFKYVGARTRERLIFLINDKKTTLTPREWLIYPEGGPWQKVAGPEQVEKYLSGELFGELFVVNDIERDGSQMILKGTHFNPAKTIAQDLTLKLDRKNGITRVDSGTHAEKQIKNQQDNLQALLKGGFFEPGTKTKIAFPTPAEISKFRSDLKAQPNMSPEEKKRKEELLSLFEERTLQPGATLEVYTPTADEKQMIKELIKRNSEKQSSNN